MVGARRSLLLTRVTRPVERIDEQLAHLAAEHLARRTADGHRADIHVAPGLVGIGEDVVATHVQRKRNEAAGHSDSPCTRCPLRSPYDRTDGTGLGPVPHAAAALCQQHDTSARPPDGVDDRDSSTHAERTPGMILRLLMLTLLVAGCASPGAASSETADPAAAVAAYRAAADAFNTSADAAKAALGSSGEVAAHQAYWTALTTAIGTFQTAVKGISMPAAAKDDGETLVKALAIFHARAADAAGATTTAEMAARETSAVAAAAPAADASAVVRDDLGAT